MKLTLQGGKSKKIESDRKEAEGSEVRPLMDGEYDEDDDFMNRSDDIEIGSLTNKQEIAPDILNLDGNLINLDDNLRDQSSPMK